jgi:hypothetical protein
MTLSGVLDVLGGLALDVGLTLVSPLTILTDQRQHVRLIDWRRPRDAKRRRLRKAYLRLATVAVSVNDLLRRATALGDGRQSSPYPPTGLQWRARALQMEVAKAKIAVLTELADRDVEQAFVQLDDVLADLACLTDDVPPTAEPLVADHSVDCLAAVCDQLVTAFDALLAIARDQLRDGERPL